MIKISIHKRGNKFSVVIGIYDDNGKYKQKWFGGFNTYNEAQEYELNCNKKRLSATSDTKFKHVILSEYLFSWLDTHGEKNRLSFNTIRGYKTNLNHVCKHVGSVYLDEVTPDIMEYLFEELKKDGLSNTTQLYCFRILHRCFVSAVKKRDIPCNYCDYIDAPKKNHIKYTWLRDDDLKKLVKYLCSSENRFCSLFLLFACCLGLRRGEILGLKWSDFDFNNRTLRIERTASYCKGGYKFTPCKTESSKRLLLMPDILLEKTVDFQRSQIEKGFYSSENFLFSDTSGKIVSTDRFQVFFKKALKDNFLPNMRIHDLRHSFASYLINDNHTQINVVSQMLGHSKVSTTLDIYTHTDTRLQESAISAFNSLLN